MMTWTTVDPRDCLWFFRPNGSILLFVVSFQFVVNSFFAINFVALLWLPSYSIGSYLPLTSLT